VIAGTSDMLKMTRNSFFQNIKFSWDLGIRLCEILIRHKDLPDIINFKTEESDVIITSAFFNDCVFGISYMLDIPVIKMCSFGGTKWMDEWVGNRSPYAYLRQISSVYSDITNFWQRTLNLFQKYTWKWAENFMLYRNMTPFWGITSTPATFLQFRFCRNPQPYYWLTIISV